MKKLILILSLATPLLGMHDQRATIERILCTSVKTKQPTTQKEALKQFTPPISHRLLISQRTKMPYFFNNDDGQRIYHCPHENCPYFTSDNSNFKRHLRTHTPERQFCCPYCAYQAKYKHNLKHHIEKKHPGKTIFCPERDKRMSIDFLTTTTPK